MPLYMDRHFVQGATAKAVAEAHQLDLQYQSKYRCKAITYWFDEDTEIAFCLIEAPDENAVIEMHKNSHGLIPNQIIEVDGNLVKLFLGRISDPEIKHSQAEFEKFINETGSRIVLKVKLIYRFSNLKEENKIIENLINVNKIVLQTFKMYGGTEVPDSHGGFLASFISTQKSVNCAHEIKEKLEKFNKKNYGFTINSAIGLSLGSPVTEKKDFFGDTIRLVERLCDISEGDKVIFSSTVGDAYKEERLKYSKNNSVKVLTPAEEKFLNQMMELTEQVWNDENFNVDDFSRKLGLSRAQLYRKVTSLTGCSPNEFIRDYRLKQALKLIEKKKGNISEIAFESGFSNPSYFSKCFMKKFGILPSDFANRIT